ncbi:hypothetical protein AVEN_70997-1 [Araneus ventricosus]|uniref:Uncharacterized protein n=1 Tax=Araneus ventricosus TaxID=182803 RepID=A0A4Y2G7M1_ARAVE|nr:hypothetical protein AVEN_70997-1 [Araneus ventricosus]
MRTDFPSLPSQGQTDFFGSLEASPLGIIWENEDDEYKSIDGGYEDDGNGKTRKKRLVGGQKELRRVWSEAVIKVAYVGNDIMNFVAVYSVEGYNSVPFLLKMCTRFGHMPRYASSIQEFQKRLSLEMLLQIYIHQK